MKFFRLMKLLHFVGLVIFLGSIFTFIVISALTKNASLENLAFGRKIISTGTDVLTLPGMWILVITGILMGYKKYGLKSQFFIFKFFVVTLVILNAHFLIVPAAHDATEIASRSLAAGHLLSEYGAAYMRESIFGAANILLAVIAAVVGVWKIGMKQSQIAIK